MGHKTALRQFSDLRWRCAPKPTLGQRPLLDADGASQVQRIFKVLANRTRLRLLHALTRGNELCVTELSSALGMKPQAISNQLQRLSAQGILDSRRDGAQVFYRIVDPCVTRILDYGLCLSEDAAKRGGR